MGAKASPPSGGTLGAAGAGETLRFPRARFPLGLYCLTADLSPLPAENFGTRAAGM